MLKVFVAQNRLTSRWNTACFYLEYCCIPAGHTERRVNKILLTTQLPLPRKGSDSGSFSRTGPISLLGKSCCLGHRCTHNSMPRPHRKWTISQGEGGNYLRVHMVFKGKEDWKGWCLKCTLSNSFYYFLKNQNKHSYKLNSPKKHSWSLWGQEGPNKLQDHSLRPDLPS